MERMKSRLGWALAGALGIVLVLALARATVAGPLDPPGPVGSTMRTIDELVPSWGKTLTSSGGCASKRFTCVLPTAGSPTGEAVLDHETGLVWQRVPDTTLTSWYVAIQSCRDDFTGDRSGWRLPSFEELGSLQDVAGADGLPAGHPFAAGDTNEAFLSSTVDERSEGRVRARRLGGAVQFSVAKDGAIPIRYWCVRGGTEVASNQDPPEWARRLDGAGGCFSERFSCVLDGTAVLDRETGLVWERTAGPVTNTTWIFANEACLFATTGGRRGWRSPTIQEGFSLVDVAGGLPAGSPFLNVSGSVDFVSSSSRSGTVGQTFTVEPFLSAVTKTTTLSLAIWCVRGAGGDDPE